MIKPLPQTHILPSDVDKSSRTAFIEAYNRINQVIKAVEQIQSETPAGFAEAAEQSAAEAASSAVSAINSATSAETSANSAFSSETAAQQAKSSAELARDTAVTKASESASSASNATTYATNAANSASAAALSELNAEDSAESAAASAAEAASYASGNASTVPFTPTGNISSANVQAAIQELDNEKASISQIPTSLPANGGTATYLPASAGSYGSYTIYGSKNTYNGFYFNDSGKTWMGNNGTGVSFGVYKQSTSSWDFYFDTSGILQVGTIPWARISGAPSIPASYDSAHSFAVNGYQKLSNGWIIQWGENAVAGNSIGYATLPISYPSAHLQCVASNSTDIGLDYSQTGGAAAPYGLSQIALLNIENSQRLIRWFSVGY